LLHTYRKQKLYKRRSR